MLFECAIEHKQPFLAVHAANNRFAGRPPPPLPPVDYVIYGCSLEPRDEYRVTKGN